MYHNNIFKLTLLFICMNKILEILIGLVVFILPIYFAIGNSYVGSSVLMLLTGGITCLIVLVGLVLILLGISDLRG